MQLYANCVVQHVENKDTSIPVWEMDKNCHGKVRYVGGWVIAKLRCTIHSTSEYSGSLELIDLKQYRDNALVYISDDTFRFCKSCDGNC